jgi:hypothetical protein
MSRMKKTNPSPAVAAGMVKRWQRLHLAVRCAVYPAEPDKIRQYLACGTQLTRCGRLQALTTQLRMLGVLLQAANDPALPWFWRSVCLEHTVEPLARLTSLLAQHDPLAFAAVQAAVQNAHDRLPVPSQVDIE